MVHVIIEENKAISYVRIKGTEGVIPVGLLGPREGVSGSWDYGQPVPIAAYTPLPVGIDGTKFDSSKKSWDFSQPVLVHAFLARLLANVMREAELAREYNGRTSFRGFVERLLAGAERGKQASVRS